MTRSFQLNLIVTCLTFIYSSDNFVPESDSEDEKPKKKTGGGRKKKAGSDNEVEAKKPKKGKYCIYYFIQHIFKIFHHLKTLCVYDKI